MNSQSQPHNTSIVLSDDCWHHTKATVTLLYLSICQIETSIADSSESVQQLTDTFTRLAEQTLGEKPDVTTNALTSNEMHNRIKQAVTAFQFYDRINQRLQHVAKGLEKMSDLFNNIDHLNDPKAWQAIEHQVEANFSMASERLLFEKIMQGATVQEAMAYYQSHQNKTSKSDIELF